MCTTHTPAAGTGPGSAPCPDSRSSCSICSIVMLYCIITAVLSLYYCTAVSVLAGAMDQPEDGADDGCHDPDSEPGVPRVPKCIIVVTCIVLLYYCIHCTGL